MEVVSLVNQLDACCYVFDLGKSYGAATPERYTRMLDTIRASHPTVPIFCVTPIYSTKEAAEPAYKQRSEDLRALMRQAAQERSQAGDKLMFVVEGLDLFGEPDKDLFHDPLHPNDAGNERMAQRLAPILEEALRGHYGTAHTRHEYDPFEGTLTPVKPTAFPLPFPLRKRARWPKLAEVKNTLLARWQANFWAGLAIVLPAVISLAVLRWLFGTVANITDTLLLFLPAKLTHHDQGNGPMYLVLEPGGASPGSLPDRHRRSAGAQLLWETHHRVGGFSPHAHPPAQQDLQRDQAGQ